MRYFLERPPVFVLVGIIGLTLLWECSLPQPKPPARSARTSPATSDHRPTTYHHPHPHSKRKAKPPPKTKRSKQAPAPHLHHAEPQQNRRPLHCIRRRSCMVCRRGCQGQNLYTGATPLWKPPIGTINLFFFLSPYSPPFPFPFLASSGLRLCFPVSVHARGLCGYGVRLQPPRGFRKNFLYFFCISAQKR